MDTLFGNLVGSDVLGRILLSSFTSRWRSLLLADGHALQTAAAPDAGQTGGRPFPSIAFRPVPAVS